MREIRGWDIGEVVTANDLTLDTANVMEEIGSNGEANLPCIYNGLTLQSQTGSGNSIVTFNPGVCRCHDLPTSIYTYLPPNAYGTSYPCFIDISVLDSNTVITLTTTPSPGYIVATFSISPNTSGATDYVITGSLLQIAIGSYNPAIHVRLCQYTYTGSTFVLDFTPGTYRDTDLTGLGGIQWNNQNSSLVINIPASQSGSSIVMAQNSTVEGNLTVQGNEIIQSANSLQFWNSGNTFYSGLQAGANTSNVTWTLPLTDGAPNQAIITNGSSVLSFGSTVISADITANDSNVIFTSSSNPYQICTPTAPRTYTMPSSLTAGVPWTIYNQATSASNYINLQTSGSNFITVVPPLGYAVIVPTSSTPTTKSNWIISDRQSQLVAWTPTFTGFGSCTSITFYSKIFLDGLYIQGYFETGSTTSSLASFSLPPGLLMDGGKIYTGYTNTGVSPIIGTYSIVAQSGSMIACYGTSGSLIYFSNNIGNNYTVVPGTGTTVAGAGPSYMTLFCQIPVQ